MSKYPQFLCPSARRSNNNSTENQIYNEMVDHTYCESFSNSQGCVHWDKMQGMCKK